MSTPETRTPEPPERDLGAPSPAGNPDERPRPRRRWLLVGLIAAGALILYLVFGRSSRHASDETTSGAAAGKGGPARTIPVVAAPAHSGDLPVQLVGLGTVTAAQHRHGPQARRRPAPVASHFQEGQLVQRATSSPRSTPGPSRSSSRRPRARRRRTRRRCRTRGWTSSAIETLIAEDVDPPAAARHAGGDRAPVRSALKSDQGQIDAREAEPHLQPDHRADHRPRRPAPRRPGQHRPRHRRRTGSSSSPSSSRSRSSSRSPPTTCRRCSQPLPGGRNASPSTPSTAT